MGASCFTLLTARAGQRLAAGERRVNCAAGLAGVLPPTQWCMAASHGYCRGLQGRPWAPAPATASRRQGDGTGGSRRLGFCCRGRAAKLPSAAGAGGDGAAGALAEQGAGTGAGGGGAVMATCKAYGCLRCPCSRFRRRRRLVFQSPGPLSQAAHGPLGCRTQWLPLQRRRAWLPILSATWLAALPSAGADWLVPDS